MASLEKHALRVKNAAQVVMVCQKGEKMLAGSQMQNVVILESDGGRGVGVVVGTNGRIAAVGYNEEVSWSIIVVYCASLTGSRTQMYGCCTRSFSGQMQLVWYTVPSEARDSSVCIKHLFAIQSHYQHKSYKMYKNAFELLM